jgi:adenylosuccinate synthase
MLDLDWGTYPYVTSSSTGLGGVFTGLALNPTKISSIIGVVKAYTTRVGSGPFPTELHDSAGEQLQSVGREWGVTTGRRRRCGWLDLVVVRFSTQINHYTQLNLTKLDILDDFEEIKVATAYELDGHQLEAFPADLATLENVVVKYETLKGWKQTTTGVQRWEDLPEKAREYVEYVEKFTGVKVGWIGTGPGRENMIAR